MLDKSYKSTKYISSSVILANSLQLESPFGLCGVEIQRKGRGSCLLLSLERGSKL